ncbi:hypothetical protein M2263_002186 [Providencia alcalifaciens]|nr:hypothetical protein [Providencia alcalifaciens]
MNKNNVIQSFVLICIGLFNASPSLAWLEFTPLKDSKYNILIPSGSITLEDLVWGYNEVTSEPIWGGRTMTILASRPEGQSDFYMSALANQWCPVGTNFSCVRTESPGMSCSESEMIIARAQSVEWANSIVAQSPRLTWSTAYGTGTTTSLPTALSRVFRTHFQCRDRTPPQRWVTISSYQSWIVIPEYPTDKSVCSLSSDINITFSSTSLNVSGLTQSTNLMITCTNGDAKDYQLKLTGSNVTNGRLNFGNGVSAQVSLNGTQVQANGPGISLNKLTGGSIPVSATLAGTASGPGVTNANGVLILDAL